MLATLEIPSIGFSRPFEFGPTEVTFREWDACVADGGCNAYRPVDQNWGRDTRPVINVSWEDAQAYVAWLSRTVGRSCRLPSEAEWEYACRAETTKEYALPADEGGSNNIAGTGLANCEGCGGDWDDKDRTAPVGQFPANAWGLRDMHGNVWEWVEDCWHESYKDAPDDGRAWLEENGGNCYTRALRGGAWINLQGYARCATRNWFYANARNYDIGFRVACSPPVVDR
jgi:formylglycine-generating enzyme required for sulfatase activity